MENANLLCEREVASILGISTRTLQQWRFRGIHLAYVKIGRLVRYRRADVEKYIVAHIRTMANAELRDSIRTP
jgi:excisionase family DNA binding protein